MHKHRTNKLKFYPSMFYLIIKSQLNYLHAVFDDDKTKFGKGSF